MNRKIRLSGGLLLPLIFSLIAFQHSFSQSRGIISGPMLGQVELRTAAVWVEVAQDVTTLKLRYWKKGSDKKSAQVIPWKGEIGNAFNPVLFQVGGLDPATTYSYEVEAAVRNGVVAREGSFTTRELWQWRKAPPDFSFLTGSCNYVNEPGYDRPGKPYGGDSSIFVSMAKERADFMLWLGDNWYTREVDYNSTWGLWYRASRDRSAPVVQDLLKAMPNYAIWDDHDFGPNDMGTEYVLKEESRKVFTRYWANPSYGEDGKGIYSKLSFSDVDIFMLDDRTWRASDRLEDSIDGRPNPLKKMFGEQQMEWLKSALAGSNATFKIIANGSQVLNPASPFDCFRKFPQEYQELMSFIRSEKISGIMFLSGDRHHSEVIKVEGLVPYPLYDITASPLTAGTHVFGDAEKNNPYRVYGLDQKQNYAHISVTGKPRSRVLKVTYKGLKGENLGEWSVGEDELRMK
ncbi:MAG: alkaline phosphatase family protein [Chitinophagaceae bacterium]|nr:alkaline phosphatase family protein [Chitinophagaceae bacterium]